MGYPFVWTTDCFHTLYSTTFLICYLWDGLTGNASVTPPSTVCRVWVFSHFIVHWSKVNSAPHNFLLGFLDYFEVTTLVQHSYRYLPHTVSQMQSQKMEGSIASSSTSTVIKNTSVHVPLTETTCCWPVHSPTSSTLELPHSLYVGGTAHRWHRIGEGYWAVPKRAKPQGKKANRQETRHPIQVLNASSMSYSTVVHLAPTSQAAACCLHCLWFRVLLGWIVVLLFFSVCARFRKQYFDTSCDSVPGRYRPGPLPPAWMSLL